MNLFATLSLVDRITILEEIENEYDIEMKLNEKLNFD
jgi:hypothetical protein